MLHHITPELQTITLITVLRTPVPLYMQTPPGSPSPPIDKRYIFYTL